MAEQQNIIGSRVRFLRQKKDLSQEAFAAQCNIAGWDISRATLSKIEAGIRRVNDAEVILLARVLKCPVEDLFLKVSVRQILSTIRQGNSS